MAYGAFMLPRHFRVHPGFRMAYAVAEISRRDLLVGGAKYG
jgi:hypothetical protein